MALLAVEALFRIFGFSRIIGQENFLFIIASRANRDPKDTRRI